MSDQTTAQGRVRGEYFRDSRTNVEWVSFVDAKKVCRPFSDAGCVNRLTAYPAQRMYLQKEHDNFSSI